LINNLLNGNLIRYSPAYLPLVLTFVLGKWGPKGSADGQFLVAHGIAIKFAKVSLLEERVFVTDARNDRIQVFKPKFVINP
jgi:hypothetical protein